MADSVRVQFSASIGALSLRRVPWARVALVDRAFARPAAAYAPAPEGKDCTPGP